MAWCSVTKKHRDNFTFTLIFFKYPDLCLSKEVTGGWRKLHKEELNNLYDDEMDETEMDSACGTHG
jgi:hypothetical protein